MRPSAAKADQVELVILLDRQYIGQAVAAVEYKIITADLETAPEEAVAVAVLTIPAV
jgi:hypothetical protein